MPRLAACLPHDLLLLDPTRGSAGMHDQVSELLQVYRAESVYVVDVGGDAVARADEPRLRSPMADGLALSACDGLPVPGHVLIAGAGLDGEIEETNVLATRGLTPIARLTAQHIAPFHDVLDWHPSEATALLAAGALGLRGTVEVRDAGLVVELSNNSPVISAITIANALGVNELAAHLTGTVSLDEAEDVARDHLWFLRDRLRAPQSGTQHRQQAISDHRRHRLAVEALRARRCGRGIDFVTFRRIAEATVLGPAAAGDLRAHLVATRPEHLAWPLWAVSPIAARPVRTRPASDDHSQRSQR